MDREKKAKLDEYDKKLIEWCLENEHITTCIESKGLTRRELWQRKMFKGSTPFPLTEEEMKHRTDLGIELKEAALEVDDEPQHLVFFRTTGNRENVKFIK